MYDSLNDAVEKWWTESAPLSRISPDTSLEELIALASPR